VDSERDYEVAPLRALVGLEYGRMLPTARPTRYQRDDLLTSHMNDPEDMKNVQGIGKRTFLGQS
jgi:hypothetical protein